MPGVGIFAEKPAVHQAFLNFVPSKIRWCPSPPYQHPVPEKSQAPGLSQFIDADSIVGIYRASLSNSGQTRMQFFQKQVEITKSFRGNVNVRYAWLGASKEALTGIMLNGFGHNVKPKFKPVYGTVIHLTPVNCSNVSVTYSDVDENGIQHMVLCRVIMGNMELVHPGSEQFQPSSENFDSGVDNLQNPKHYIIWKTLIHAHISRIYCQFQGAS